MNRKRARKLSCTQKHELRLAIAKRDGTLCYWCGKKLLVFHPSKSSNAKQGNKRYMTLDHIIPHAIGGSDDLSNLVGSCIECNLQRATWFEKSRGKFIILENTD
jgi:5-methylcytosine-specific restriction endonuclease McrA